jgi:hypothetical protein
MKTTYDLGKMTMLSGLIFACPMEKSHESCPFFNLRRMSVEHRLVEIANYSNREITQAVLTHKACLMQRSVKVFVPN